MLHRKLATIYDGWLFFVFEVPGFNLVQADSDGDSGKTREGRICVHDLWCCNNVRSVIKCGVRPLIFQENLNLFCCAIYTRTQTGNASRVALNQRPPLDFCYLASNSLFRATTKIISWTSVPPTLMWPVAACHNSNPDHQKTSIYLSVMRLKGAHLEETQGPSAPEVAAEQNSKKTHACESCTVQPVWLSVQLLCFK